MKTLFRKALMALLLIAVIASQLTACSKAEHTVLEGKWGYVHDPSTVILEVKGDRLTYGGKKYSFSMDQDFLYLKNKNEDVKLRYLTSGDHTYIYQTTEYILTTNPQENALIGIWENKEKNWSFEFTKDGEFLEDGFFPGTYTVSDHGTFKLMYIDHFENTECYYNIKDNVMTVEYPWEVVKAENNSQ